MTPMTGRMAIGVVMLMVLASAGCDGAARPPATGPRGDAQAGLAPEMPCPATRPASGTGEELSRFAVDSPFDVDYKRPEVREGKRMWARSLLYDEAPKLVVEKWLTDEPDTKGKYVLVEFWATWCPPCRRSIAVLNGLHKKFGDELVVIGISDETEAAVRDLKDHKIEYFSAIDTEARMKGEVGVFGIPHVIVIEPNGFVVWEGFPLLKDYELTDKVIENILAVGRKLRADAAKEK